MEHYTDNQLLLIKLICEDNIVGAAALQRTSRLGNGTVYENVYKIAKLVKPDASLRGASAFKQCVAIIRAHYDCGDADVDDAKINRFVEPIGIAWPDYSPHNLSFT